VEWTEGYPVTVVVPVHFASSRDAAAWVQRAVVNALGETNHDAEDLTVFYDEPDGRTVKVRELLS
jgi:hypothetical protein